MQSQLVFKEEHEIERLRVQNRLLSCYEGPVLARILSEGRQLAVLDIGCNDGMKTVKRFSHDSVSHVIGIEYNEILATKAKEMYGDERFSFYRLDVEAEDFSDRLRDIMREKQIEGFDVIYLSFVLMHLTDASKLLVALRPFLRTGGKLLIIEAHDAASTLTNDPSGLLGSFLEILKQDKYSGNREVGASICGTLAECGYGEICVWHDCISAGEGETEKKQAILTTFFSYLSEDVALLRSIEPENPTYRSWAAWLDRNYDELRQRIMEERSVISMGMNILTCTKGKV